MTRLFRRVTHWIVRLLLRAGLLPGSTKTDSDTMGEYKRLMAEKDDPKPGLVLPDPNAPHAALIRRVRLYAQNGAKALAPILDRSIAYGEPEETPREWIANTLAEIEHASDSPEVYDICAQLHALTPADVDAVTRAYNSPWTVIDGEVYEYESEKKRRVVQ